MKFLFLYWRTFTVTEVKEVGKYTGSEFYERDVVHSFYSVIESGVFKIDPIEIHEAQWFDLDSLPETMTGDTKRIAKMFRSVKV